MGCMDQLSYGSLGLISVATFLILWLFLQLQAAGGKKKKNTVTKQQQLPPGPWNLPIIGSLHHLMMTGMLPHRALLRLSRRHGPLMLLRLGEVPTVVVSSPEAAMEVLKTNDLAFATRPGGATLDVVSCGGKGLIFAPYGEHWRQMRKVCVVEVLSARQVQRMESIKQEEVANLVRSVDGLADHGAVVNLTQKLFALSNNLIARAVFGGKCPRQEAYLRELDAISRLVGGFSLADLFPSSTLARWLSGAARDLRRSHTRVQHILGDIIKERKLEKKKPIISCSSASTGAAARDDEDLLDVLLRLQKEDTLNFPLTSEIIGAVIFDIFAAATDTTAATLEWAMAELIRKPHAMARAKLEVRQRLLGQGKSTITSRDLSGLHYLRMVVKETLRLHPAASLIHRASQDSCQVMGYDIPKGTPVTINVFAVGRDPRHWGEDVEEFRPERFEDDADCGGGARMDYSPGPRMEFIPFGAGRRQCPGALFATTTIELVLANLLCRFDWAIPGPEPLDLGEVFGIIVHSRSPLCLRAATCHLLQEK